MHSSVLDFVQRALPRQAIEGRRILEAGSRDVNGSVRPSILRHRPEFYVGIDVVEGPGVDRVLDAAEAGREFPESFDVVISTEMLEHARDWRAALDGMTAALKPGGTLILTTRGPGFPRHEPPDHWRFRPENLQQALSGQFDLIVGKPDPDEPGVFISARKAERPIAGAHVESIDALPAPESRSIYFVASEPTGGSFLRSFWPAQALRQRGHRTWASALIPPPSLEPAETDVVIIHRPLARDRLEMVRSLQAEGLRVLVDEDDDLLNVHETQNEIARREWTEERRDIHDEAVRAADGVIVSSDALMELYGSMAKEAHLIENAIPSWVQERRFYRTLRDQAIRVGWSGLVLTHRHDLEWIRPHAQAMMEGAVFSTVGDAGTASVLELDGSGEAWAFQHDPEAYYDCMARADIGIVPLMPCAFNEAKSYLKALEYMTLGKPVVVTDMPEQRKLVRDGVDGFLVDSPEAFAEAVRWLIGSEQLREVLGRNAQERAREFSLDHRVGAWEAALQGAAVANA